MASPEAATGPAGFDVVGRCWLFHAWSKWETYVTTVIPSVQNIPVGDPFKAARQKRTCARCGKEERRWL